MYSRVEMKRELQWLANNARHVTIVPDRIKELAISIQQELQEGMTFQTDPRQYPNQTLAKNDLDTLQFYLVLTSQHFCIWHRNDSGNVEAWDIVIDGERYVGGRGINAAHIRALRQGENILDADYLASMTLEDARAFYQDERDGRVTLQLLPQRLAKFNELGRVLKERYKGHVSNLLQETGGYLFRPEGRGLVQQLLMSFPISFFDWPFNKLAILFGKFLLIRNWAEVPTTQRFRELSQIQDPENFEIAADYYIPLFLIRTGVFRVSPELTYHLKTQTLIDRNSRMEQDYRACTMVVGWKLAEYLKFPISAIDEELWRSGFQRCRVCREDVTDEDLPCPHRDISVAYQSEHDLMSLAWPLVLTTCY